MSEKRGRGRPEDLNDKLLQIAKRCIEGHLSIQGTCRMMGISRSTWYSWKRKSKNKLGKDNEKYIKFFQMVRGSLGEAELNLVLEIQANKDWKAKLSILKRRFAESWDNDYIDLLRVKDEEIQALQVENQRLENEIDDLVSG